METDNTKQITLTLSPDDVRDCFLVDDYTKQLAKWPIERGQFVNNERRSHISMERSLKLTLLGMAVVDAVTEPMNAPGQSDIKPPWLQRLAWWAGL